MEYMHKVNYYETDAMGVTHHSNYVRWMEEARVFMMDKMGFSYKKLEEMGVSSPVIGFECDIKHSTCFDDEVIITANVIKYNEVKLSIEYIMKRNDTLIATGESRHCFVNKNGMPVRLSKVCEEFHNILKEKIKN